MSETIAVITARERVLIAALRVMHNRISTEAARIEQLLSIDPDPDGTPAESLEYAHSDGEAAYAEEALNDASAELCHAVNEAKKRKP